MCTKQFGQVYANKRNNFSEMFSLNPSLYSPYYDEACKEFAMLNFVSYTKAT